MPTVWFGTRSHLRSLSLAGLGLTGLLAINLACGGGGTTNTTPVTPPTPVTSVISGCTAKGIIQNGAITAFEWSGGSWVKRGETATDLKGEYALNLIGYTGQAIKLTLGANANTKMIWDGPTGSGHTFGVAEAVPAGFTMQAVLPVATATLANVPVTPYTTMATTLVEASANKDAVSIQKAIATINVLTGFDVAHTKVVDITSLAAMNTASITEQRASAMIAALAFISGKTVSEAVTQLSQSVADGRFDGSDPIGIAALTTAWTSALANPGIASNLSDAAKNDIQVNAAAVTAATVNGVYTLVPPVNPPATEIAAAKGLISDTRSLISNIIQTDFQSPLGAVGAKVEAAGNVFNQDAAAMVQILGASLDQAMTQVGTATELRDAVIANGTVTKVLTITDGSSTLGTLNLKVSNARSVKIELSGALKGTAANARTITLDASIDTGMDLNQIDWNALTTTQTSTTVMLQATIGDGVTSLNIPKGTIAATVTPISGGTPILTALSLTDLTLGLKTEKADFSGNASFAAVKLSDTAFISTYFHESDRLSLKAVSLSGTFSLASGETFKANASLDLANAETFDLIAFLNRNDSVYVHAGNVLSTAQIQAIKSASGLSNTTGDWYIAYSKWGDGFLANAYDGVNYVNLDPAVLFATFSPDSYFRDQFKANPNASLGSYGSVWIQRINGVTTSQISAMIQLGGSSETISSFMQLSTNMDFELTGIAGLPAAKVALSATRSTLNGGSATIGVTWGTSHYTFTFSNIDIVAKTGSLTIANGQGVSLQLKDINAGSATGALYVGAVKVADVKQLTNGLVKVSYTDGTFETLQ